MLLSAENADSTVCGNPLADPKAVVVCGNARFTVLTDRLIRMEYAPDGRFEDRASLTFVNRALPVPAFTSRTEGNGCVIETKGLTLTYAGGAFTRARRASRSIPGSCARARSSRCIRRRP